MTSNFRAKTKEAIKAPSVKIVSTCPKDDSCDNEDVSTDCNVESWLKALKSNFFQSLVVTAAQVPGLESLLRKTTKSGDWKGTVIDLFEQVVARIPSITSYTILEAETPQEAKQNVLSGRAVLDLTPTALTSLLPTDLSYVPISDNINDTWHAFWVQPSDEDDCNPNSLAVKFTSQSYGGLTFLERIGKYISDENAKPFVILINSDAQKEYILRGLSSEDYSTLDLVLINFDYVPAPTSAEELFATLNGDNLGNLCNTLYFGAYLPLDCGTKSEIAAEYINLSTNSIEVLNVSLSEEEQVNGYGWAISSWAYHWQIWLQFAIDSVVKAGKYPKHDAKKKSSCEDEDEFACCLKLSAPPPLYGFCIHSLPLVNVGERLLETPKCITPHAVVQNGAECGTIKW